MLKSKPHYLKLTGNQNEHYFRCFLLLDLLFLLFFLERWRRREPDEDDEDDAELADELDEESDELGERRARLSSRTLGDSDSVSV